MSDDTRGEPERDGPGGSPDDSRQPDPAPPPPDDHGADALPGPEPRPALDTGDPETREDELGHEESELEDTLEDTATPDAPPEPVTFDRQRLASTVRWVWLGGYLVPVAILSLIAAQLDVLVLETAGGLVTSLTFATTIALAVWRTVTRYRAWSWELTERQLVIDRGVVFELTRIVPRARVQHVDISSGPLDRFFGLRSLSIYTAGTREADASIPGLTADRAEELRAALIGS